MSVIHHSHEGHTIKTFGLSRYQRWVAAYRVDHHPTIEVQEITFAEEPDAHWAALRAAKHAIREGSIALRAQALHGSPMFGLV